MPVSVKAQNLLKNLPARLGDLRSIAKEIKMDHDLALELWGSGLFAARMLAILIMDKKQISQEFVDQLEKDSGVHTPEEQNQLIDWLMANQLTKGRKTIALMESWENSEFPLQRRIFWYYQGRLRWVGQTPPPNSSYLLSSIEQKIEKEHPQVQWAMNFTAAQIGIYEPEFRNRCIALGEHTQLYKDEIVAKNCTPSYLPDYIAVQLAKLKRSENKA